MAKPLPDPIVAEAAEPTVSFVDHGLADGVGAVTGMPDYTRREFTVTDGVATMPAAAARAFRNAHPSAVSLA